MPDENVEKKLQEFVEKEEKVDQVGPKITEVAAPKFPHSRSEDQVSLGNQIGWQKLPIIDLPTQGLFYPEGAQIAIRAATANEVRHWSTIQDDDVSAINDMMNYILERCMSYKISESAVSSWKDIKEIDRFYILLAIREYTFVKGENHLQVSVSETDKINVTKDMIDYINFDEKLMKYYDPEKRCFSLKFKTGRTIDVTIPSAGVTNFVKRYIQRKQQSQQMFDQDFITFAPFILREWRGLSDSTYEQMVVESNRWSIEEISVLTHVRDLFLSTINPVVKYVDQGGAEQTAPLNFRGGIKSIFLISDPFGQLA